MSAIVVIRRENSVSLLADTACLDQNMNVAFFQSKIIACGPVAVVTGRGDLRIPKWFGGAAQMLGYVHLDAIVKHYADIRSVVAFVAKLKLTPDRLADEQVAGAQIILAGWSDANDCPQIWSVTPWRDDEPKPAGAFFAPGLGIPEDIEIPHPSREAEFGVAVFDAVRAYLGERGPCGVGGELEQVVLRRDGGSRRILNSWQDQIGQPITPRRH